MSNKWIEKYSPKNIKEIIGNNNTILKINHFFKNFDILHSHNYRNFQTDSGFFLRS